MENVSIINININISSVENSLLLLFFSDGQPRKSSTCHAVNGREL